MSRWRIASVTGGGLTRRELLSRSAAFAAAAVLPMCRPTPPVRDNASPASPVNLRQTSPIGDVSAPANAFLGDDFRRPHDVLWKIDELLAQRGGVPPPRERAPLVVVGGGMSGLASTWKLRRFKPILLEQGTQFGGNARGERWNDITYSIGAAYLAKPAPTSRLQTEFYGPLGVDKLWRPSEEDPVLRQGKIYRDFWSGVTDPARRADIKRIRAYLERVRKTGYPDIPFEPGGHLDESQLAELDKVSFYDEVVGKAGTSARQGPALHPHAEAMLDHYGWSTFGGGIRELSAAAFLCAYVAEFDGTCALPGGNSAIAHKLLEALAASVDPTSLRAASLVVRVKRAGPDVHVTVLDPDNRLYTIAARAVVMACPKFVARKLLPELPPAQAAAIARIRYRSYCVANVLITAPSPAPAMDLYLLADDSAGADSKAASDRQRATDVILGHWAQGGHPRASVLTLYRPYPFDGARAMLYATDALARVKQELTTQVRDILPVLGIHEAAVAEVRVSRFGHALNLSETGFIADGTWAAARAPLDDRIFFVEQDNWPAPAIETCLTSALLVEPHVSRTLATT